MTTAQDAALATIRAIARRQVKAAERYGRADRFTLERAYAGLPIGDPLRERVRRALAR
jgi:hypothetical protein